MLRKEREAWFPTWRCRDPNSGPANLASQVDSNTKSPRRTSFHHPFQTTYYCKLMHNGSKNTAATRKKSFAATSSHQNPIARQPRSQYHSETAYHETQAPVHQMTDRPISYDGFLRLHQYFLRKYIGGWGCAGRFARHCNPIDGIGTRTSKCLLLFGSIDTKQFIDYHDIG